MQQALKDYFENENLLFKNQHGIRKKHSTTIASIYFCDSIRKKMNNGKLTGAAFADLSKAFNTIGHSVLSQKLSIYGVKSKEIEWFNSIFLAERTMFVSTEIFLVRSQYTVEFPKDRLWGHYCLLFLSTTFSYFVC